MSNYLAINAALHSVKNIIESGIGALMDSPPTVSLSRPIAPGDSDTATIRLFLYQVLPNAAVRNNDLPTRRADGSIHRSPSAAVDLYVLSSFYGATETTVPQAMGAVIATLTARPVVLVSDITDPSGNDLASQTDRLTISMLPLTLSELSSLWSSFFQMDYAPSIAWRVSVVRLEVPTPTRRSALPVTAANVYVRTFKKPVIEKIRALTISGSVETETDTITNLVVLEIQGAGLRGDDTRIVVGDSEFALSPTTLGANDLLRDSRIRFDLADVARTDVLRAGVNVIQVQHYVELGADAVGGATHRGFSSNLAVMVLRPRITGSVTFSAGTPDVISVSCSPPIDIDYGRSPADFAQKVKLLLTRLNPTDEADGEQSIVLDPKLPTIIDLPSRDPTSVTSLQFELAEAYEDGDYLVRLEVDGVESPLTLGAEGYDGPLVTFP